jgi:hypothetical protein
VDALLAAAETEWEYDMFALDEATAGHPLSTLAFYLMVRPSHGGSGCATGAWVEGLVGNGERAAFLQWGAGLSIATRPRARARPLARTRTRVQHKSGLVSSFRLPAVKLARFMRAAEAGYKAVSKNPYHNNVHAADVTQVRP